MLMRAVCCGGDKIMGYTEYLKVRTKGNANPQGKSAGV